MASCAATAPLAAGCGSRSAAELPAPAGPPTASASLAGGRYLATVDGRARTLTIRDARTHAALASAPAGVGPTHVGCIGAARCYVTDTRGDALLVFLVGDDGRALRLTRRVYLPGGPYAITVDAARRRLRVTLPQSRRVAVLPAHGRPHVLATTLMTYNNPDAANSAAVNHSHRAR
jgi:hypothetical protein